MRAQFEGLRQLLEKQWGPPCEGVTTEDLITDAGIRVRVYKPDDSAGEKIPLGVFYHSGGYCIGRKTVCSDPECSRPRANTVTDLVRNLCLRSQTVIVSVDYRLAPEHTAPVALGDCCDTTLWAIREAGSFGADASCVYTTGPSAGATLSISVFLKLYDEGYKDIIKGIVSMSPCFVHPDHISREFAGFHASFINSNDRLLVIDTDSKRVFYGKSHFSKGIGPISYFIRYIWGPQDDKYAFVFNYPDLSVLPSVYHVTAELDPLRDDGLILDKKLSKAKVLHILKHYDALPHIFWIFPLPQSKKFFDDTAKGIAYVLGN